MKTRLDTSLLTANLLMDPTVSPATTAPPHANLSKVAFTTRCAKIWEDHVTWTGVQ